jgi:replication factor C subunit 3/5
MDSKLFDDFDTKYASETRAEQLAILPWIEKYRPTTLNKIISNTNVIKLLKTCVSRSHFPHHLLFYGPPGTGKTSAIMASAKEMFGEYYSYMVLELNASDDRGIETVRTRIRQFVMTENAMRDKSTGSLKLVILDEIDAMTDDAQSILRNMMERFANNARFCLICNYVSKINPALHSRCTSLRFAPLFPNEIKKRTKEILDIEEITYTDEGIDVVVSYCDGDMRKVLNLVQSTSMAHKTITKKLINTCVGYPQREEIEQFVGHLTSKKSFADKFTSLTTLRKACALSLVDMVHEIYDNLIYSLIDKEKAIPIFNKFDDITKATILSDLREIEINQLANATVDIQIAALLGLFTSSIKKMKSSHKSS